MLQALLVGFGVIGFTPVHGPAALAPGAGVGSSLDATGQVVRPPMPVSPLDNDTVLTLFPTLVVDAGEPFYWYQFRVMEEASVAAEGYSLVPMWSVAAAGRALQRGHVYHWSCRAWTENGWSPWFRPDWYFTVGSAINPPSPKLPANGAVVSNRRPVFAVAPTSLRATYHFQVWDGKTLVVDGRSDLPTWRTPTELEPGIAYTWTCRIEAGDTSDWFRPMWAVSVCDLPTVEDAGVIAEQTSTASRAFPSLFSGRVEFLPAATLGPIRAVSVYTADGRLVRELAPERPVWDGQDRHGRDVGPGMYVCRIVGLHGLEVLRALKVE
ncbi:MAG: hypothetical protein ABIK86_07055 [candidate division WOR-3 bacterium]